MKALNMGIIMIVIIVIVIYSGISFLHDFSEDFNQTLAQAQSQYDLGNKEEAARKLDELKKTMDKSYTLLCIMLDHRDVTESEMSLLRLTEYVKTDDKILFNAECSALIARIDNIYTSEKLNISNVF